jgi:hypothetical protein
MIFRSSLVLSLITILLIQFSVNLYAADKHRYQVFLQNNAQTDSIRIASIEFKPVNDGYDFIVSMNEDQFGDYFLSMRPFKCMTDKINMLCHLAYPYEIKRHITDQSLTALEYGFLFIRRKPSDYGINPWNGLYYPLHKQGEDYIGQAHEVDLDILAAPPPDSDPFPIKQVDLHEIDAQHLWLPRLLIKAD